MKRGWKRREEDEGVKKEGSELWLSDCTKEGVVVKKWLLKRGMGERVTV